MWLSKITNGKKYLLGGNNIVYFSENGLERGVIQSKIKRTRKQKYPAKEMRDIPDP